MISEKRLLEWKIVCFFPSHVIFALLSLLPPSRNSDSGSDGPQKMYPLQCEENN